MIQLDGEQEQEQGPFWALTDSHGNRKVTLKVGSKERDWKSASLESAKYELRAETTSFLKGPRKISIDLQVTGKDGSDIHKETHWLSIDTLPVALVPFTVKPEQAPATITLNIKSHALLGSMNVAASLNKIGLNEQSEFDDVNTQAGFDKLLGPEELQATLTRNSEYREQAIAKGVIRPFLYLASMHPIARYQVAKKLGIKLPSKKFHEDSHAEAWELLSNSRKGIQFRSATTTESMFGSRDATWYLSLFRVAAEVLGKSPEGFKKRSAKESLELDTTSKDPTTSQLEVFVLQRIAEKQKKSLPKGVGKKVEKLETAPEVVELVNKIVDSGTHFETLKQYLVELSLLDFVDDEEELEDGVTADDVVHNLVNRARHGYDPRSKSEVSKKKVANAAKTAATVLFNKVFLMAAFPPAGIAVLGMNITSAIFGPSHDVVFSVAVMVLLQRLLLGIQGINIDKFY